MLPTLVPGDKIIAINAKFYSLNIGDVVIFFKTQVESSDFIVHRIVKKRITQWVTRGDNNRNTDDNLLDNKTYIGKVVAVTRNGRTRKVVNGFPGWVYAMVLYLENWAVFYFKKLFYPLYDTFRAVHRRHPIWHPNLTHFTIQTEEKGTIIKVLHHNKTIARYWLRTGAWYCKHPFDLVLTRPPVEKHQLYQHNPCTD